MGEVRKTLKITIIITVIFAVIFALVLNYTNNKIEIQELSVQWAFDDYGYCYECNVNTYIDKDELEVVITAKDEDTKQIVKFLNDHGYQITLDEILNDYEKGIEILKQYKKDYDVKYGLMGVGKDILMRMHDEGYL